MDFCLLKVALPLWESGFLNNECLSCHGTICKRLECCISCLKEPWPPKSIAWLNKLCNANLAGVTDPYLRAISGVPIDMISCYHLWVSSIWGQLWWVWGYDVIPEVCIRAWLPVFIKPVSTDSITIRIILVMLIPSEATQPFQTLCPSNWIHSLICTHF